MMREFQGQGIGKGDQTKMFYEHYFGADQESKKIPLESYYYPLTKTKAHANQTLNAKYFAAVFSCPEFKRDFQRYLDQSLIRDYNKEIAKKLGSLAQKFEQWNDELGDEIRKKCFPEKLVSKIKAYSIKNQRCKLPWCSKEIKEAISRVQNLMNNLAD